MMRSFEVSLRAPRGRSSISRVRQMVLARLRARRVRFWISRASERDRRRGVQMRVLITGGAGFVGSHLAEALLERGDEVFVIDDLSTGSIDNITHLKSHPKFH